MYTGVVRERQQNGAYGDVQTQCLAVGDGVDYKKYAMNPVLDKTDIPEGSSVHDFRDPKMWQAEDGIYCCVVWNQPAEGISFFADGVVNMDVVKYDLVSEE